MLTTQIPTLMDLPPISPLSDREFDFSAVHTPPIDLDSEPIDPSAQDEDFGEIGEPKQLESAKITEIDEVETVTPEDIN
jgi:hypothetical protein